MISYTTNISIQNGLHIRPASSLSGIADANPQCDIFIIHNDKKIDARSMIHLLLASIKQGDKITITINGCNTDEENEVLEQLLNDLDSWTSK